MRIPKLKPCPFCGGRAKVHRWLNSPVLSLIRPCSQIAADSSLPMEGVVARPAVELKNRRGGRVIVKIKARDFA